MNILMICNTDGAMFNFRGPLIKRHVADGDKVYCMCNNIDGYSQELYALGVDKVLDVGFDFKIRHGIEFSRSLKSCIHEYQITHIHVYTIVSILYFFLVSEIPRPTRVVVATFTGLGRLFGPKSTFLGRTFVLFILGIIFKKFNTIFFQNEEDFNYFSKRLSFGKNKYQLVYGSGIEIEEKEARKSVDYWSSKLLEHKQYSRLCLMASRLVIEKGYKDFYACADLLKKTHPDILFVHIGPLNREIIAQGLSLSRENLIILPYHKEYKSLLELVDVFVLPSYYREGIPRSLIEAVLFNKRIVTTNYSGCKHTVIEGKNGYLVSPKNPEQLAQAILSSLSLDELQVSKANTLLLKHKFNINIHYRKNLEVYDKF